MNNPTPHTHSRPVPTQGSDHWRSALLLACIALLFGEGLLVSQSFDAYGLVLHGNVTGWRAVFAYLGDLAKIALVTIFIFLLLAKSRIPEYWRELHQALSIRRVALCVGAQLVAFFALLAVTGHLFGRPEQAQDLPLWLFAGWWLLLLLTIGLWLSSFTDLAFLSRFIQREAVPLSIAFGLALAIWMLTVFTRNLWGPMSEYTFVLSGTLLQWVSSDPVTIIADRKVLGLGEFLVNIAPACSGYEGIGLVSAFVAVYLYTHKASLRFPHALLLLPVGILTIWLLNAVRIVVLILIGHHWSPEVAVGGFHSQAGWLTFILTSLGILWLASSSGWLNKAGLESEASVEPTDIPAGINLPIATLLPMMALLALTLLTSALTADFNWWYPLRVLGTAAVIGYVWRHLELSGWQWRWQPLGAGLLVAVLWWLMVPVDPEFNQTFTDTLSNTPTALALAWLLIRFIGASITVPIAEELAFRGYLLCTLSGTEVKTRGAIPLSVIAVVVSSIAFGVLHGAWVAGTVAGIIYAVVRLRSDHIGDAIVAHGVTNALLFVYAGSFGAWHLL